MKIIEEDILWLFKHRLNFNISYYKKYYMFTGIFKLFMSLFVYKSYERRFKNLKFYNGSNILVVITSTNQAKAINSIQFSEDYNFYIFINNRSLKKQIDIKNYNNIYYFNVKDLINHAKLNFRLLKFLTINKKLFSDLEVILRLDGIFNLIDRFLVDTKIDYFLSANDHSIYQNLFLYRSKLMKVKSIFIQHAQTNTLFPPIRYDIALLWGDRDKRIYGSLNTYNCKLIVVGRPIHKTIIRSPKEKLIGIAYNRVDNKKQIKLLINYLSKIGYNILLRPHPNTKSIKGYFEDRTDKYFKQIQIQISGNSGIHLEACDYQIPTYLFPWIKEDEFVLYPDLKIPKYQFQKLSFKHPKKNPKMYKLRGPLNFNEILENVYI